MTIHLSIVIFLPLAGALVGTLLPARHSQWGVLAGSVGSALYAIVMAFDFDRGVDGLQYVTDDAWISELGIRWSLGVDGLNLWLIVLTALLWVGSIVYAWRAERFRDRQRPQLFWFHVALAETAVLGALCAQDLALFVFFFDLMLVPFYFLIGQWGEENRVAATTKMVIYTLVGSLLMLAGAIALGVLATPEGGEISFSLAELQQRPLGEGTQQWIFLMFAAAFLVKAPVFPLHGWMPDAYRAAPLPVLVVFSGVLAKVGAYGFLRVVLPLFPDATVEFQEVVLVIALASILYGSVMAFTQTNVRLIAGYSSVAQLGFITAGIFALRADGSDGAVLQMVNHGLVVAPLFVIVAILLERTGTEDIREMGGMALRAPVLAALFLIVALATLAMPGSANFVGEFYILNGLFQAKIVFAFIAISGVAMSAYYALRLYQQTMHNRKPEGLLSREIGLRDGLVLVPLVLCILGLALYPQLILERTAPKVQQTVARVQGGETPEAKLASTPEKEVEKLLTEVAPNEARDWEPTLTKP